LQVARSKEIPDPQLTTQFAHRLKLVSTKTKPAKAGWGNWRAHLLMRRKFSVGQKPDPLNYLWCTKNFRQCGNTALQKYSPLATRYSLPFWLKSVATKTKPA